jgi:predicted ATPase
MRFDHVLTQEALYGELPVSERRRLHARTAEALRSAGNGTPDLLAHHLRQAAPLGLAEDALAVTCEAAGRARKQLAYEHAAFQYRQALDLLALVPDHASREPGLLLDLARCEFRSGAVDTAWDSCRRAADLARAAGDGATVATRPSCCGASRTRP